MPKGYTNYSQEDTDMPLYEYKCTKCTAFKSIIMNISRHDTEKVYCDKCNALMYEPPVAPAIANRANLRIAKSHMRQKIL